MLYRKNLYNLALNIASTQELDESSVADIRRQYGDHLYIKGDSIKIPIRQSTKIKDLDKFGQLEVYARIQFLKSNLPLIPVKVVFYLGSS